MLPALLGAMALVVVAVALATASSTKKPTLTLRDQTPVVVGGSGFAARERVRVKVQVSAGRFAKSVTAGRRGRFTARFAGVTATCGPVHVSAVGQGGSRAGLVLRGREIPPPCGIDPQP